MSLRSFPRGRSSSSLQGGSGRTAAKGKAEAESADPCELSGVEAKGICCIPCCC